MGDIPVAANAVIHLIDSEGVIRQALVQALYKKLGLPDKYIIDTFETPHPGNLNSFLVHTTLNLRVLLDQEAKRIAGEHGIKNFKPDSTRFNSEMLAELWLAESKFFVRQIGEVTEDHPNRIPGLVRAIDEGNIRARHGESDLTWDAEDSLKKSMIQQASFLDLATYWLTVRDVAYYHWRQAFGLHTEEKIRLGELLGKDNQALLTAMREAFSTQTGIYGDFEMALWPPTIEKFFDDTAKSVAEIIREEGMRIKGTDSANDIENLELGPKELKRIWKRTDDWLLDQKVKTLGQPLPGIAEEKELILLKPISEEARNFSRHKSEKDMQDTFAEAVREKDLSDFFEKTRRLIEGHWEIDFQMPHPEHIREVAQEIR